MNKVIRWENHISFLRPGCGIEHAIRHGAPGGWGWNGSLEAPTFSPSVLVNGNKLVMDENGEWGGDWERDAGGNLIPTVCHSFVIDGRIQFLTDSTHHLAGQTVDLPPMRG